MRSAGLLSNAIDRQLCVSKHPGGACFLQRFSIPKFPTKIKAFPLDLGQNLILRHTHSQYDQNPTKQNIRMKKNLFHLRCLELKNHPLLCCTCFFEGAH